MRKHDPRKWLHAVLDLLPVILIPVFMVYSHRHTINDLTVEYQENRIVDFNQQFNSSNSVGDIVVNNTYDFNLPNNAGTSSYFRFYYNNVSVNDKVFLRLKSDMVGFRCTSYGSFPAISQQQLNDGYTNIVTFLDVQDSFYIVNTNVTDGYSNIKINFINLTTMFGEGSEPTLEQFVNWYPNYYAFTLSHKELVHNYNTVTYNNTDIGSQLLYSIYNPVHDYMNFNNVFNFGQIYDWLQLNIFGGTAPMSVFIVWNIVLYEFLMDLIFLLYALFMFFIDFCTNLIDRFHTKCSGGK